MYHFSKFTFLSCCMLLVYLYSCSTSDKKDLPDANAESVMYSTKSDSLLVLTYNICWSCMDANGDDVNLKFTPSSCLYNLADYVDSVPGFLGYSNFDFVAFQEAEGAPDIQSQCNNTLSQMNMVYSSFGSGNTKCEIATFYNNRYTATDTITDTLKAGRPAQILIFQDSLIFVNVHNCHYHQGCDMSWVEQQLSRMLVNVITDTARLHELKSYRILVAGDFNFGHHSMTISPFAQGSPIQTTCSLSNPPVSCCNQNSTCNTLVSPWHTGKTSRPSDLIFDSYSVSYPNFAPNYNKSVRRSDHLPVIAILPRQ